MIYNIFSADSFRAKVTVLQEDGSTKNLSGATAVAVATNGTQAISGVVNLASAATGEIGVVFSAGAMATGNWEVQVRVTLNGETQTVSRLFVRVEAAAVAA